MKLDQVLTPTGNHEFLGVKKTTHDYYYKITFTTGETIKVSASHIFDTLNGGIMAEYITKKDEIHHRTKKCCFITSKRKVKRNIELYDLVEVSSKNHVYYTNNVLSHNCDFLGSSNTLLDNTAIQALAVHVPISETEKLKVYQQPIKGHSYIATVDVSQGIGKDFSIINIMDVTETPYRQVLVYRDNEIDPTDFASVIYGICKRYNSATLIVESNNDGKLTGKELFDLEYEPLITSISTKENSFIKGGKRSSVGVLMTGSTKKIGCSRLKHLIETQLIQIVDEDTINEFSTFVQKANSYEADVGKHDDCVMTLVMFSWFTTTDYFEDISGNNARDLLKEAKADDDLHTLLGFIGGEDDGMNFDDEFQSSLW